MQARSLLRVCKPFSLPFTRLALMKRTKSFSSSCYEQCSECTAPPQGAAHPGKNGLCLVHDLNPKASLGFCFVKQMMVMDSCLLSCEDVQCAALEAKEVLGSSGQESINSRRAMVAIHWSGGNDSVQLFCSETE